MDRDPSDIPEQFRTVTNEISAEEFEKLKRVQAVMVKAQADGILCTGRPDLLECPNPPFTILVLHGHGFALPCIDCVDVVVRALMKAGHPTVVQTPLKDSTPERLKAFAIYRRKVNAEARKFVIPEGSHRSRR